MFPLFRHRAVSVVLHMAIPVFQRRVWTSEPSFELMKEQTGIFEAQEFYQHFFCLTSFDINSLQDCNDVLEQEIRVICSSGDTFSK